MGLLLAKNANKFISADETLDRMNRFGYLFIKSFLGINVRTIIAMMKALLDSNGRTL